MKDDKLEAAATKREEKRAKKDEEKEVKAAKAEEKAKAKAAKAEGRATKAENKAAETGEGSAATISNDPFFIVRGEKTHFWLPVHSATPLLKVEAAPNEVFTLLGETFGDQHA